MMPGGRVMTASVPLRRSYIWPPEVTGTVLYGFRAPFALPSLARRRCRDDHHRGKKESVDNVHTLHPRTLSCTHRTLSYTHRTASDSASSRHFAAMTRPRIPFEFHLGHVFSQLRGVLAAECAQMFTDAPPGPLLLAVCVAVLFLPGNVFTNSLRTLAGPTDLRRISLDSRHSRATSLNELSV